MRRLFRIVGTTARVICLLLCLALFAAWLRPHSMERVIWWTHVGDLRHYHLATIRDGKLLMADYRETSISPTLRWYLRSVAEEPLLPARIEECTTILRRVAKSGGTDQELADAAICQARLTEAFAIQTDLLIYRAYYTLPSKAGIGSDKISDRWPDQPLRATTRPANYADNLMRRLNDGAASVWSENIWGLSYSHSTSPYARRRIVVIPLWLIIPLLLVLPAHVGLRFLRSRRRRTHNLCPTCGYDLRASPDQCPECGAERQPGTTPAV